MAESREHIKSFLRLVTQELVYYIVTSSDNLINWPILTEQEDVIPDIFLSCSCEDLVEKREELKTLLEDRFVDFTGGNFNQFLRECSSVYLNEVYCKKLLEDYISKFSTNTTKYRKRLLVEACSLIMGENKTVDVNRANRHGNTPLHLISALPLGLDSDVNFFQALLKAGANPLATNELGLNILHIIFGGTNAIVDEEGHSKLKKDPVFHGYFPYSYSPLRYILSFLSAFIDEVYLDYLKIIPDQDGNTVMHDYILNTMYWIRSGCNTGDVTELASQLVDKHGLNLKFIKNKWGHLPIHYAYFPWLFKFLVGQGSDYRARSSQGETPFLFVLKHWLHPNIDCDTFAAVKEESVTLFGPVVQKDLHLVRFKYSSSIMDFLDITEVKETVFIPDANGILPLTVVLVATRLSAYHGNVVNKWHLKEVFFENMLKVLTGVAQSKCVKIMAANTRNNKGQNALHVLLDIGEGVNQGVTFNTTKTEDIVECLKILLEAGADVNAVDEEERTAMHIVCRQFPICPALFGQCGQILMNYDPKMDLKDHSNETVHDLLLKNEQLRSIFKQRRRKVQCNSQKHHTLAVNIPTSIPIEVIGKYRYTEESQIAHGSFGCVYVSIKDEHENKKSKVIKCRTFALKRLEKARIDMKEIEREMNLLLELSNQCKHIVSYHETMNKGPFYYISLELMDGDLAWFISDHTIPKDLGVMVKATLHMLNGLAFLHGNEFIHRDLKPSNILVSLSPTTLFKIGDFGLAKDISKLCSMTQTASGVLLGTRCWMAPELVSFESEEHTIKSDLFSLGLVLHYLFSLGFHPFTDQDNDLSKIPPHTIEKNIEEMKLTLNEALAPEAKHMLMKMLTKSPAQRKSAAMLEQHFFVWSKEKKNAFLIAVGNEEEAANPRGHPNSALEQCLQNTDLGKEVSVFPWDGSVTDVYLDMTSKPKSRVYRTTIVLELLRFIRNAYFHKQERSANVKAQLEKYIFLTAFPTLVLDVYVALEKNGFLVRNTIKKVLSSNL